MAEQKYSLSTIPTVTNKKIQEQPWYRERLRTKYIKSLKPTDTCKSLSGKTWTFLKDGLDDFRDGLPPPLDSGFLIERSKGISPNITGSNGNLTSVKQQAARGRYTKEQMCYSRCTPLQQQRRDHIDEIEYGLSQHPLALYPHLEECIPPDLFEEVVEILDPEMNLDSEDASIDEDDDEDEVTLDRDSKIGGEKTASRERMTSEVDSSEQPVRNPYRWLPRVEEKKDKKKSSDKRSSSPSQEEHIKSVTKEFCDWVSSLGGESNNIEESTITSLFASGYETKPALSVPIHVVELTNVPPELRMSSAVPVQQPNKNLPTKADKKKEWVHSGSYEPSWVKFRYGAWYLPPKTWEKRDFTDPLRDPKELKDQESSDAKEKSHKLNVDLSQMHGSKAFMDFMDKKGTRKPEFLDEIRTIQRKAMEEDRRRLQVEQAAKMKKLHVSQKAAF
ncbi:protein FAM47E-like [Liolophura sinensis]|uniref:protein FAM47E-like n=1 Tax=Liolophura sinensis TaxID=3198878 RepID=UPI003159740A